MSILNTSEPIIAPISSTLEILCFHRLSPNVWHWEDPNRSPHLWIFVDLDKVNLKIRVTYFKFRKSNTRIFEMTEILALYEFLEMIMAED